MFAEKLHRTRDRTVEHMKRGILGGEEEGVGGGKGVRQNKRMEIIGTKRTRGRSSLYRELRTKNDLIECLPGGGGGGFVAQTARL
jgi:hypothetical protein